MTKNVVLGVLILPFFFCEHLWAKPIRIENGTGQAIATMTLEHLHLGAGKSKARREFPLGLAASTTRGKNHVKRGDEPLLDVRTELALEIGEVADEDCLTKLTFRMDNGRDIQTPVIDLCNLDAVVVEDDSQDVNNGIASP